MCRNIKPLFNFEPPVTDAEIELAALQYVRKVSGFTRPSQVNEAAFSTAVADIVAATKMLLNSLETKVPKKQRAVASVAPKQATS